MSFNTPESNNCLLYCFATARVNGEYQKSINKFSLEGAVEDQAGVCRCFSNSSCVSKLCEALAIRSSSSRIPRSWNSNGRLLPLFINVLTHPKVKYDRKFFREGGNGKEMALVNGISISRLDDNVVVARMPLLHDVVVVAVVSAEETDCFPDRLLPTTMLAKHEVLTRHNITETISNMVENRDGFVGGLIFIRGFKQTP